MFGDLADGSRRYAGTCFYTSGTVFWGGVLGFALRHGAALSMDTCRNSGCRPETLWKLSGQPSEGVESPLWPCSDTLRYWLGRIKSEYMDELLAVCSDWVFKSKLLDDERLRGCTVIAVDGTKREKRRNAEGSDVSPRRVTLYASIVTRRFALPFMTEELDRYRSDVDKEDCELEGLKRLFARIKARYPKKKICLVGDALYACETVYALCEKYGWHFIATFKEGRSPAVFAEAGALMDADPVSAGPFPAKTIGGAVPEGRLRWAEDVDTGKRRINVVECTETKPRPYHGCFATDLPLESAEDAYGISLWGRRRWNMESSFNVQKHGGYGLGHNFCDNAVCSRNMHLLMQVAYFLWEVFEKCLARPKMKGWGKFTSRMLAEKIRASLVYRMPLPPEPGLLNLHKPAPA